MNESTHRRACGPCIRAKVKCDMARPCMRCMKKAIDCFSIASKPRIFYRKLDQTNEEALSAAEQTDTELNNLEEVILIPSPSPPLPPLTTIETPSPPHFSSNYSTSHSYTLSPSNYLTSHSHAPSPSASSDSATFIPSLIPHNPNSYLPNDAILTQFLTMTASYRINNTYKNNYNHNTSATANDNNYGQASYNYTNNNNNDINNNNNIQKTSASTNSNITNNNNDNNNNITITTNDTTDTKDNSITSFSQANAYSIPPNYLTTNYFKPTFMLHLPTLIVTDCTDSMAKLMESNEGPSLLRGKHLTRFQSHVVMRKFFVRDMVRMAGNDEVFLRVFGLKNLQGSCVFGEMGCTIQNGTYLIGTVTRVFTDMPFCYQYSFNTYLGFPAATNKRM